MSSGNPEFKSHFRILVSATEASADRQLAQIVAALKLRAETEGVSIEIAGIGGEHLRREGVRLVYESTSLSSMGFVEVVERLPRYLAARKAILREARRGSWDLALLVDAGDFHLPLGARFKVLGLPVIDFIPPKAWIWRKYRTATLSRVFERVLCTLPFEENWYRSRHVAARFVGNPWIESIAKTPDRNRCREALGISSDKNVLVWMPGSRLNEIRENWDLGIEALAGFLKDAATRNERWTILVPSSDENAAALLKQKQQDLPKEFLSLQALSTLRLHHGESAVCLRSADLGLIKSGTSTLEAGILDCPHVILYQVHPSTDVLVRQVFGHGGPVGLINLCLDGPESRCVVPEVVGSRLKASELCGELTWLWSKSGEIDRQKQYFKRVRDAFGVGADPRAKGAETVDRAADEVFSVLLAERQRRERRVPHLALRNLAASTIWAATNLAARKWIRPAPLVRDSALAGGRLPKVISVGNLQAGGSGKTPWVRRIARDLMGLQLRVCVLSRGVGGEIAQHNGVGAFGRREFENMSLGEVVRQAGDEAAMVLSQYRDLVYGVGPDRRKAFQAVCQAYGDQWDVVILDDGLQQFSIQRDLDIILVTDQTLWDIPYREAVTSLRSIRNPVKIVALGEAKRWVARVIKSPALKMNWRVVYLKSGGAGVSTNGPRSPAALIAGVGDFEGLKRALEKDGWRFAWTMPQKDHAVYTTANLSLLLKKAKEEGLVVLTTAKDFVKWRALEAGQAKAESGLSREFFDGVCVVDHEPSWENEEVEEAPWVRLCLPQSHG